MAGQSPVRNRIAAPWGSLSRKACPAVFTPVALAQFAHQHVP
jgi:hypothetical protein